MTENFPAHELACKCGCGMLPRQDFMDKVQKVRDAFGKAMIVTSAARCPDHNASVSATKSRTGPHTTGRAIDIAVSHKDAHRLLIILMAHGFTGIGVNQKGGSRFLHMDDLPEAPGQPRPHLWSY
jgi:uncharacterized protein YcbK (DUF882 family)